MSMYKEVSTNLNFVEREKETEKFWEEHHVFEESVEERKDDPSYTFYDGPPTANGKPHIGHLETRAFKDLFPRYQTMKGKHVLRKAGWDTHGLPIELKALSSLGDKKAGVSKLELRQTGAQKALIQRGIVQAQVRHDR